MDKNDNIITNNAEMANILAAQYKSVFSQPKESYENFPHMDYKVGYPMCDVRFTKEKIKKQIAKLKNGTSSGPDGILGELYKNGGEYILDGLVDIYTQMWEESYSPQQSREAWIAPVWKGENKLLPVNYRPIALTNQISKIFEGILREAIIEHIESLGIKDTSQHGSQKGRSTTSQLLAQLDIIFEMIKDGANCEVIYLDFSKAYDKVDQTIALGKMWEMGIQGKNLNLIQQWLTNRRQRVKVGDSLSEWEEVISGIPQGSVLGPLIFILYIWDLRIKEDLMGLDNGSLITKILKYIDDTKVIANIEREEDIPLLQEKLEDVYRWEEVNNMKYNGRKFMNLRIGPKNGSSIIDNTLIFTPGYSAPISQVEVAKDLGMMVDANLDFKVQKERAINKADNKVSWIMRTFVTRDCTTMRMLWKSLVQSHQDYGCLVWSPTYTKCELEAQEGPLRRFTERIEGMYGLNYWQRLEKVKLSSINRRVERFRIFYTWKSLNGKVPSLGFTMIDHPKYGRQINISKITGSVQSIRTKREKSIFGQGPILNNCLPRCIREYTGDFDGFKRIVDIFLSLIPDRPCLKGYCNNNMDSNQKESNSITVWIRNLRLSRWTYTDNIS